MSFLWNCEITHSHTHTHTRTHTHTHCACDSCNVPYPHACLPAYIPLDCSDCSKIAYIHRISVPHTANRAITSTGLANHLSPLAPHDSERHFRSRTHSGRVDAPESSFTPELCRGGDIQVRNSEYLRYLTFPQGGYLVIFMEL